MMWPPNRSTAVWLYRRPTDKRRSFDGLSALAKQVLEENPLSDALFVFVNRRKTQMRCLYFEGDGRCIWAKRLERGRFRVPFERAEKVRRLESEVRLAQAAIGLVQTPGVWAKIGRAAHRGLLRATAVKRP